MARLRQILSIFVIGTILIIGTLSGTTETLYAAGTLAPTTKSWKLSDYDVFKTRLKLYVEKQKTAKSRSFDFASSFAPTTNSIVTSNAPSAWFADVNKDAQSVRASTVTLDVPAVMTTPVVIDTPATKSKTLTDIVGSVTFEEIGASLNDSEKTAWQSFYAQILSKFPEKFLKSLQFMRLRVSHEGSRGLAGSNIMILKVLDVTKPEAASVSVHELGHVVDLGYLNGAGPGVSNFRDGGKVIYSDDPSVDFYAISFSDEKTTKNTATKEDFVTGYAMSDPFEDFSETFNYYVIHGEYFKMLATGDSALAQKYAFMRDKVFDGKEFTGLTKQDTSTYTSVRPWDATLQAFDYMGFWERSFR